MKSPPASRYNVGQLLFIGLVFHLVYIGSVFDCYFTSPVVKGMTPVAVPHSEAKRLVLIVGDGLRADLLFSLNPFEGIPEAPKVVAPYLREVVESRGAFGISHTRVPTESRPGHVAIIAGMYEDVSAVTKGWKSNPVDFDSVFNQSSTTFSFGSPDILPMFARGAVPGRVRTWCYDEEDEDFTKDARALDVWVLEQLQTLFRNASSDPILANQLKADGTVFFLHLLGLDTTGHSYRPHSKEYMQNIQVVDEIVEQTERLFSDYFRDDQTSFIFTADHGMSVIGNHGDGHPDNTRTPLIAWGAGIRGPLPDSSPSSHDEYSQPWELNNLLRRDIEQADIAALMTSLLGTQWPVNSVGVLPDTDSSRPGYLAPRKGDEAIAQASFVNAKALMEHYRVKHEMKRERTLFYRPFKALEGSAGMAVPPKVSMIQAIQAAIDAQDWTSARKESVILIETALEGLRYLQTYDRFLIRAIVTVAYVGWAAYSSLYIFRPLEQLKPGSSRIPSSPINTALSLAVLLSFWTVFALQRSPWTFYLYVAFPCYFWHQFLAQATRSQLPLLQGSGLARRVISVVLVVGVLQCMTLAYTHREIWSFGLVLIGVVWPLTSWSWDVLKDRLGLYLAWMVSCLITAVFPMLPVDKSENLFAIMSGGVLMIAFGLVSWSCFAQGTGSKRLSTLLTSQLMLIALAMWVTYGSVLSLQAKTGLPVLNQYLGWMILVTSSILPFIHRVQLPNAATKTTIYVIAFGACFIILSISIEGLFYLAYTATLQIWIEVEAALRHGGEQEPETRTRSKSKSYEFRPDDLRIALFFLFFVQIAFFGTGNVASISSFYLEPVYRLVPIFSPFLMAALLIFKIVAPYVILSISFSTLNARLHLPPFSLFLVALTLTDGMTLTFFYKVSDTGSWLEIGQSISFFCITSLLLLWSAGICAAGEYLMSDVLSPERAKVE
ncbi:Glycosyl phosphatidyl inositol anchor synthesis [Pleurotus ostreatus]|uniref:GPI ethanolamine phosphate transferase 1 n=1 Tax=Pleurotus ostreatus TaxID=5322 RepID=A0A8H6ZMB7_PLEOS|nr:Glycosyl phosphatidyl inositol anchor synthesis [Pleurotus ostreatus]KAF7421175.1 Glycosyl phosphatidyl inositol anchor synthesis [Pleurotus ostreatus]KAJ8690723.1 Glycosyl phosphatidyl inositol anchor synthesis [Pleurotus ostreatus]